MFTSVKHHKTSLKLWWWVVVRGGRWWEVVVGGGGWWLLGQPTNAGASSLAELGSTSRLDPPFTTTMLLP